MILRRVIRGLRWTVAPAMLLALWLPGANQGGFRVDTGLYAAVALHAFRDGALFPLVAGELPYFNKPPFAFWIHGVFLHLLGPHLWVARLPSLLAAVLAVTLTGLLARRVAGPRVGLSASIVLALTLEFFRYTRAISLDLWVVTFMLGAMLCAARLAGAPTPLRPSVRDGSLVASMLAGLCIALALLTKPLIGLLALPILAAWLAWARVPASRVALFGTVSVVTAVALAAPWHIAMHLRYPDTFTSHYLGVQSLDRAAGEGFDAKPLWYYALLLAQTYWPWLAAAVAAQVAVLRRRSIDPRQHRPAWRLALLWTLVWFIALSLFAAKMGRYALVLYPSLAIMIALWLTHAAPRPVALARRAVTRYGAPVMLAVAAALVLVGVRVHAPVSAHWNDLERHLREADPRAERLWTHPDMLWSAANIYLFRGVWPRFITAGVAPPPGALVLYSDPRPDDPTPQQAPASNEPEVWRSGRLFITQQPD